ncbi:hypothetical protein DPMN_185498 [Dreissena polymorpha]|uniref:Uncharacterized protein n=1 Tax=Dreissena polymorpha TaxID=45954 RepID=A0A9D4DL24_DREPO|nr:hypothetical protein DPMN_185498 [Dreissena polymorpha]
MSTSVLLSAREALIECCRNAKDEILECLDWIRVSSRSVYENITAKFDGYDRENNEVTPRDQPFIAGRVQSRQHSEMPTGRSTACRIQFRRRSEMATGRFIDDKVQYIRLSKMPTSRSIAARVHSRRLCEMSTGSERNSSEQIPNLKLHIADSFVTTKTVTISMQSKPEQHATRIRSGTLLSKNHGNLNSMPFLKHKKQTLHNGKNIDRNFVKGHSDGILSNIALNKMQFHEDTSADEMRERLSRMPSTPSRQSYTNEQSLKCNVSESCNLGLNRSKQGSKTKTANNLFRRVLSKQKSADKIIARPTSQPDFLNKIAEPSLLKQTSGMRRTRSGQNEEHFANNSSYHASFTKFGDVSLTSVDPKKKLNPCKDAGYDPSTIVPSVNYFSAAAEENKPHFQKLRSIVKNIQARKSLEEIAFNKVKALCHNRNK